MDMDSQYSDRIQQAVAEVEQVEIKKQAETITLSTGVKLKLKHVPILRINAVLERFPYPEVPVIWDEEKGRELRNPNHPAYVEMRQKVDEQRTWAILDAVAALGTEVLYVPDGIDKPEDASWTEELEVLGIAVRLDSKVARYLAWIKFVAIGTADDMSAIARQFGLALGVSEARIAGEIRNNFPDK